MDIREAKSELSWLEREYSQTHITAIQAMQWLITEHDRLTAELAAADRGQANLTSALTECQEARERAEEALEITKTLWGGTGAELVEATDVLRRVSSCLGQGLMADTENLDYPEVEARIMDGIDTILRVEVNRREAAESRCAELEAQLAEEQGEVDRLMKQIGLNKRGAEVLREAWKCQDKAESALSDEREDHALDRELMARLQDAYERFKAERDTEREKVAGLQTTLHSTVVVTEDRINLLKAQIADLTPFTGLPTVEGAYWVSGGGDWHIVDVGENLEGDMMVWNGCSTTGTKLETWQGFRWVGPLPQPEGGES